LPPDAELVEAGDGDGVEPERRAAIEQRGRRAGRVREASLKRAQTQPETAGRGRGGRSRPERRRRAGKSKVDACDRKTAIAAKCLDFQGIGVLFWSGEEVGGWKSGIRIDRSFSLSAWREAVIGTDGGDI
jgi:hypothetical protein